MEEVIVQRQWIQDKEIYFCILGANLYLLNESKGIQTCPWPRQFFTQLILANLFSVVEGYRWKPPNVCTWLTGSWCDFLFSCIIFRALLSMFDFTSLLFVVRNTSFYFHTKPFPFLTFKIAFCWKGQILLNKLNNI